MNPHESRNKVLTHAHAIKSAQDAQTCGETVVFTNGCFDLLHVGHIHSLEEARQLGDRLVVALNSDASVRALKGESRPIVPLSQRMRMVASLACVDWVVSFPTQTPLALLRDLKPDIIAKGGDWKIENIVGGAEVEGWGGQVVRLGEIRGIRTSELIRRIRE